MKNIAGWLLVLSFLLSCHYIKAQKVKTQAGMDAPVILKNGALIWKKDGKEVALFGVNYTAPFAHAYRAIAKTGLSHEEAIRQDVYHFARLGLDAFRVHVWDTEISDTAGNLLENEHLRLFDFLLAELKKYQIKTIVTPIAFWGNGYPERDEATPGFARKYGKGRSTTNDTAIRAQENYLQQFFRHVNPYTGLSYQQDPEIIATEINNEPNHSGPQKGVTEYINRLYTAIRSTGWNKPIFYNISENPGYAAATVASKAEGYSFQWYPSGLVGGRTLHSNFLPHVDTYRIPFGDSLPAFKNKPLMVYEFDPADIMAPIMYPAMARSFRAAGFQWATQFAYDPLAIAHANTEYQTHYLNLAYTPAKALSLMIAGEVFRFVKRNEKQMAYPADSVFGPFRISYREGLSVMNSPEKFLYTGHTATRPVQPGLLKQVAGTGNSPIVAYSGTGAYFLDKINEATWRLEVMPDAVPVDDPYKKTAPFKTVSAVARRNHTMRVQLPGLGTGFSVKGIHKGNSFHTVSTSDSFRIEPGTYILTAAGKINDNLPDVVANLPLNAFVAPAASNIAVRIFHTPPMAIMAGRQAAINATVFAPENSLVSLLCQKPGWNRPTTIAMQPTGPYTLKGYIPAEMATPGLLQYRLLVQSDTVFRTFPGDIPGNPSAWDYLPGDNWEIVVKPAGADIPVFRPGADKDYIMFPAFTRGAQQGIGISPDGNHLVFQYQSTAWPKENMVALQTGVLTKTNGAAEYNKLIIRGKSLIPEALNGKLTLISKDGLAWSAPFLLQAGTRELELHLSLFRPDGYLLLPRPYPGFHPLWFRASANTPLNPEDLDFVQLIFEGEANTHLQQKGPAFEVEWLGLRK